MLMREIPCPVCNGNGYVSWVNVTENGGQAGSKMCPHCNGTGIRKVLITNADWIRKMTDKEMATELIPMIMEVCEDGVPGDDFMLWWLQRPVEE